MTHSAQQAPAADRDSTPPIDPSPARRIALVTFVFNWPTFGGGNVHSVELARFLRDAGYDVQMIVPQYVPWGIGRIDASCPFPVEAVPFTPPEWTLETILGRLRERVADFDPETVILSDSWNLKPHLYRALRDYRVILRMQAQECLCPLNNLRLIPGPNGPQLCSRDQLGQTSACRICLKAHGTTSGELHRRERELARVDTDDYEDILRSAFREAHAVLVLNPEIAAAYEPFCENLQVVPWGMDPARFPADVRDDKTRFADDRKRTILFAGLRR